MIPREFVGGPMDGDIAETWEPILTLYVPVRQPPSAQYTRSGRELPTSIKPRLVGLYTLDADGDFVWAGEVWR